MYIINLKYTFFYIRNPFCFYFPFYFEKSKNGQPFYVQNQNSKKESKYKTKRVFHFRRKCSKLQKNNFTL